MANIKRNLVYNFILSVSQVVIPLVSIPYVSWILGPEGIGHVGFIDSLTYYFVIIAEFGITVYGIREVARVKDSREKLGTLVSELLTLHIISSLFTLALYSIGVLFLWQKIGDIRLLLFSLSFLLVNFFACDWYFMGTEKFAWITWRTLIIRLLGLASIFILVKQPADYYIYYAIIAVSAMASTVWNAWMLFRDIPFSFRKVNWKKHLRHVWVTYLISLFYSVPLLLDSVLLRLVSTVSAVGMYVFSAKIVRTGVTLLTDSFLVFFPRIVSLGSKSDNSQLRDKLLLNIQFVILVSLPMGMGLYLLADELTVVFLGNQFMPVADNIRLLSVFPFLKGVSLFLSNPVLIAHDKEKSFLRNLVFSTALFVCAALLLGYYYNDFGVCIALVAVELFLLLANYISVKRSFPGLPVFDFVTFGHSVAGSLLLIPVVYLVKWMVPSNWQQLVACIPACILVYGLFLFLVRNRFMMQVRDIAGRFVSRNF